MSQILFHYQPVNPTTWAYLSSLLMIGLFFKFSRFWSVRNVDLILLMLLAPGLLLIHYGGEKQQHAHVLLKTLPPELLNSKPAAPLNGNAAATGEKSDTAPDSAPPPIASPLADNTAAVAANSPTSAATDSSGPAAPVTQAASTTVLESVLPIAQEEFSTGRHLEKLGYIWLLSVSGVFLIRLLLDPTMVRRPLLEPNLSTGGLIFLGCSLFIFLMANVLTSVPTEDDLQGPRSAAHLLAREAIAKDSTELHRHGPGYAVLNLLPSIPSMSMLDRQPNRPVNDVFAVTAKTMAILAHLAVVIGIVAIGYQHFDSLRMGIGAATLYLMLPYTALMTGRVTHVLPAALLVWAILCYRRPLFAGIFIGLAMGVVYYPLFLLPLWVSFYAQRGLWRFALGLLSTLVVLTLSLVFVSESVAAFWEHVKAMFGLWLPVRTGLEGIWGLGWDPVYRLPVLAAFVALSSSLAIWPAQKNLGTLLSCSSAVMVATQFWHGHGGGLFLAWYLPLALLTIFRPNLEDRIALAVLGEAWFPRRKAGFNTIDRAA